MRSRVRSALFLLQFFIPAVAAFAAVFPRAFHLAGLSHTKRGQRVDVTVGTEEFVVEHAAESLHVPFARTRRVVILEAARHYDKTTAVAAGATGALGVPLGALLILKKHRVDTVVVSYTNNRGGELGLVLQMEKGKGLEFGNMLKTHGIVVVDPPPDNPGNANKKTASGSREGR